MTGQFSRRMFLETGTAIATLGAFAGCGTIDDACEFALPVNYPAIDTHCHVFNGKDLSAYSFFAIVLRHDYPDQGNPRFLRADIDDAIDLFAAFLFWLIRLRTPSARKEIEKLTQLQRVKSRELSETGDEESDDQYARDVATAFEMFFDPDNPLPSTVYVPQISADRRQRLNNVRIKLFQSVIDEVGEEGGQPARYFRNRASRQDLARKAVRSHGFFGRHIKWVKTLRKYRFQITNKIKKLYGPECGPVRLFTPSIGDFGRWLDEDPAEGSDFENQMLVLDQIAQLQTNVRIHPFMAFDPWRQVEDGSPLRLLERAIKTHGFVGVKLYPPMGFRATKNSCDSGYVCEDDSEFAISKDDNCIGFPCRATTRYPDFGNRLDEKLKELYAWCDSNDVAIMAHATNSQSAGPNYGERAHPKWWRKVLNDYPNLRLNLGHFGGFDEAFDDKGNLIEDNIEKTWEWELGRIIKDDRRPNVFADLSYMSEILSGTRVNRAKQKHIPKLFQKFILAFDPNVERVMYGSDWIMLGREPRHQEYIKVLYGVLIEAGLSQKQMENFFGRNGARFLGLNRDTPSRKRLLEYCDRHGMRKEFYDQFLVLA